jgi:hypothetical protein
MVYGIRAIAAAASSRCRTAGTQPHQGTAQNPRAPLPPAHNKDPQGAGIHDLLVSPVDRRRNGAVLAPAGPLGAKSGARCSARAQSTCTGMDAATPQVAIQGRLGETRRIRTPRSSQH